MVTAGWEFAELNVTERNDSAIFRCAVMRAQRLGLDNAETHLFRARRVEIERTGIGFA